MGGLSHGAYSGEHGTTELFRGGIIRRATQRGPARRAASPAKDSAGNQSAIDRIGAGFALERAGRDGDHSDSRTQSAAGVHQSLRARLHSTGAGRYGVAGGPLCALGRVATEAKRASEIIQSVRNFIRNSRPTLARIQPNKLVREAMSVVKPEADQAGISIALNLASALPAVMVDRVQIEQVLINLLRNGVEVLREHLDCERRLVVRTSGRTDGYVKISVKDNGPGLSAEARASVLKAFYTTKPQGMGLGLTMSGFIVREHGGRLWVESEQEVGATFYFTLPTSGA